MGNQKTIINSAQQKGHTKVERFSFFPFFWGGVLIGRVDGVYNRWNMEMKEKRTNKENKNSLTSPIIVVPNQ